MRVIAFILGLVFCWPAFAQTAGPDVSIQTSLDPDGEVYVGQTVRLWVEITSDTQFSEAPFYPELKMDGAIVFLPEQLGVNFSTNDRGVSRVGQRQRYVVIPQRAGTLTIPSITIPIAVAAVGQTSEPIELTTDPVALNVIFPTGMEGVENVFSTRKLVVEESYDRGVEGLKVGDAITRTVTMRGEDTFALAMPKIAFAEVAGARVYLGPSKLDDKANRGNYTATRVESATYVFETAGEIELPEILVNWWNLEKKSVASTVLPSVSLSVAVNPAYSAIPTASEEDSSLADDIRHLAQLALNWLLENIVWLSLLAIAGYIVSLAAQRFAPILHKRWIDWRERVNNSEEHYFAEFRRASKGDDDTETVRRFWRWIDSVTGENITPTLQSAGSVRETDLQNIARQRYGAEAAQRLDGRAFYRIVQKYRRNIISRQRKLPEADLDRLNPGQM